MKVKHAQKLPREWLPLARLFDGLGDASRQKILLLFDKGEELTIKQMCDVLPLSRTSVVHHVTILERAHLLERRKAGRDVFFKIDKAHLIDALERVLIYAKAEV